MSKQQPKQKQQQREIRTAQRQKFEVRSNADGSKTVRGYFARFNSPSVDMGFREVIAPGAFTRSLKDNPDVLCLYDHTIGNLLGRTTSGTLQLEEDSKGLRFTLTLPDTNLGRDLAVLMERGDISGCSFGFATVDDDWQEVNGEILRTLREVLLFEGSIVAQPAYPSAGASLRNAPAEIRAKLLKGSKRNIFDIGAAPDEDDSTCDCDCDSCVDGDCSQCTAEDCDDDNCADCPMQDDDAEDRARRMDLITRRLLA